MKKTFLALSVTAILAGGAFNASAIDYGINHTIGVEIFHSSYADHFDLLVPGYDPAVEHIISAQATFNLFDPYGGYESVDVFLDSSAFPFTTGANIVGGIFGGPLGSGGFSLSMLDDNQLHYEIVSNPNSEVGTMIVSANLLFSTAPGSHQPANSVSVPDGGMTLALLGMGVAALGAASRRFRRRS